MKIAKNNQTNKIVYLADDIEFGVFDNEKKYKITTASGHFFSTAINEDDFSIVEVQIVPADFTYEKYVYTDDWEIDSSWTELNEE